MAIGKIFVLHDKFRINKLKGKFYFNILFECRETKMFIIQKLFY